MGRFGAALAGPAPSGFVAAGSGITPVLSMVAAALADPDVERGERCVDCNRTQRDVMFLDELADLKDRHPDRLQLVHVLTREPQESELLSGRLDAERLRRIRRRRCSATPDGWFLCGPFDLVTTVHDALVADGVDPGTIHTELFHAEAPPAAAAVPTAATGTRRRRRSAACGPTFTVQPGEHVLDALLRVRGDAPYACKGGVCGTCRAHLVEGTVTMDANWALEPDEIERGTCSPASPGRPATGWCCDYDG